MKKFTGLLIVAGIIAFFAGVNFAPYFLLHDENFDEMNLSEQREMFIAHKEHMIGNMINNEDYACCLEKPCVYCIEKTPGHGEGATCSCLEDVVNGVHPCGECIGEILEGHGNPFLAKYFARSVAEEVGEEHIDAIKKIISSKYKISVEDQI